MKKNKGAFFHYPKNILQSTTDHRKILIWPSEQRKPNALVLAQSCPILTYETNFGIRFLGSYLLLLTKSKILRHKLLSK